MRAGRTFLILVPYMWLLALFLVPFGIVFKISLSDYSKMIYAFYLIAGVGIMIVALSLFIFIMRYQGQKG